MLATLKSMARCKQYGRFLTYNFSSVNTVTILTCLLHWQNAYNLWSDFCGQREWKLVKFTEELCFGMAITLWMCWKIQGSGDNCWCWCAFWATTDSCMCWG